MAQQQSIARWVSKTNRLKELGDPFTPATPAMKATYPELDREDRKDRKGKDRDKELERYGSRKDKDRGREKDRERDKYDDRSGHSYYTKDRAKSSSRPAATRSKTGPEPPSPTKPKHSRRASYDPQYPYGSKRGEKSKSNPTTPSRSKPDLTSKSKYDLTSGSKYDLRHSSKSGKSKSKYDLPSTASTSTTRPKNTRSMSTTQLPTLSSLSSKHPADSSSKHPSSSSTRYQSTSSSKTPLSAPPYPYVHPPLPPQPPIREKPIRSQTIPTHFAYAPAPQQSTSKPPPANSVPPQGQAYPYPYGPTRQPMAPIQHPKQQTTQYSGYPYQQPQLYPPPHLPAYGPVQPQPQIYAPQGHVPVIPVSPQSIQLFRLADVSSYSTPRLPRNHKCLF